MSDEGAVGSGIAGNLEGGEVGEGSIWKTADTVTRNEIGSQQHGGDSDVVEYKYY